MICPYECSEDCNNCQLKLVTDTFLELASGGKVDAAEFIKKYEGVR